MSMCPELRFFCTWKIRAWTVAPEGYLTSSRSPALAYLIRLVGTWVEPVTFLRSCWPGEDLGCDLGHFAILVVGGPYTAVGWFSSVCEKTVITGTYVPQGLGTEKGVRVLSAT